MAIESVVVTGLKAVHMAPLGKVRTAVWEQIGYTLEGSVTVNFEAPTATGVMVEELDTSILTKFQAGAKSIEFDFPNLSSDMLTKLMGATVDTTGVDFDEIDIPDGMNILNKMLKIDFLTGLDSLCLTNAQLASTFGGGITKTGSDTFNIHMIATINAGLGGTDYEAKGIKLLKAKGTPTT